jgi:hypothetical protein
VEAAAGLTSRRAQVPDAQDEQEEREDDGTDLRNGDGRQLRKGESQAVEVRAFAFLYRQRIGNHIRHGNSPASSVEA